MPDRSRLLLGEGSRYGIVLLLLICTVMITIISLPSPWRSVVVPALQGASVLVAVSRPGIRAMFVVLVAIVALSVGGAAVANNSVGSGLSDLLNAGVIAVLPVAIVARLRRNLYVNVQTVLGAVSIYLVIGMLFASFDSASSNLLAEPFFAGGPAGTRSQYMYFSFITLTTVGYGDLTPGPGAARALSVIEALIGQLYLVTVIALLVANFGRARQQAR